MKIICISDTHGKMDEIKLPPGDLLIHAGDATFRGNVEEITRFNRSLGLIRHLFRYGILFVAGNHDWMFEKSPQEARALLTNAHWLQDEAVEIKGLTFYGTAWQPFFCDWAFNRQESLLPDSYRHIPGYTDVLITHCPPRGILDVTPYGNAVGSPSLRDRVQVIRPKLHIFGHIHHSYGQVKQDETIFVNAASCSERYHIQNPPIVIDL